MISPAPTRNDQVRKVDATMMEALGKVYEREVHGALNGSIQLCQLPKKMTDRLVKAGLVERAEHQVRDRFGGMTIHGCVLTHAGRFTYCASCEAEGPVAVEEQVRSEPKGSEPAPESPSDEETARHKLHLAWRLRNSIDFKSLPPIAADEIKQAAAELEAAALPAPESPVLLALVEALEGIGFETHKGCRWCFDHCFARGYRRHTNACDSARNALALHRKKKCQASWRDGECRLADKDCPSPTKGDPSNCPWKESQHG